MTPRPPAGQPFPTYALSAWRRLVDSGREPSARLTRAAGAEARALEHAAMGLPGIAEKFRQDAQAIMLEVPSTSRRTAR